MGFDDLRRFSWQRGSMPVYASAETMADLHRVFKFAFENGERWPWYLKPEPHIVCGPFSLGETTIIPLPVPHGETEVNGYLFTRQNRRLVAYLSDCSEVPEEVVGKIRGVECLIIDALREKPHPTHLSVAQALEVARHVEPRETYLTHIAHELPQTFESKLPPQTHIAYDGLKLRF